MLSCQLFSRGEDNHTAIWGEGGGILLQFSVLLDLSLTSERGSTSVTTDRQGPPGVMGGPCWLRTLDPPTLSSHPPPNPNANSRLGRFQVRVMLQQTWQQGLTQQTHQLTRPATHPPSKQPLNLTFLLSPLKLTLHPSSL